MSAPLPHAPAPDWRRYLLWALIWVAFVAALGYSASQGGLGFLENDVSVTLEPNRERVALGGAAAPVIEVKVRVTNNTREPATLRAASACKVFRWQIFSRSGDMVQSKVNEESCPTTEVVAILPPGEKVEEFYAIVLERDRFRAGDAYLVYYWYWGYEGEFQFTAE
jgi:hypothetical protein